MGATAHTLQDSKRPKRKSDWGRWLGRHIAIPHKVITNSRYQRLGTPAKALLNDLLIQLNGFNNGDIAAAQTLLAKYGWKDSSRKRALKQLVETEILIMTRVGGKHRCCLYAVTWLPIDDLRKTDMRPTKRPPIDFNGETLRHEALQNR
jgi:hypothetical protein